ncbi:MAG: serine carboxypeptidase [Alphaproteobacteria bacterium]|nr:serine carboxypeptidase [Alphaproteobacteria bacterium]
MTTGIDWARISIAIVGGDRREQEIARLAAATGARVKAYGFPLPPDGMGGIGGVGVAADAGDALDGARFALFPMAGMKDGLLYAPQSPAPIRPDASVLKRMAPGAHIILGHADAGLKAAAAKLGIQLHEREHDKELRMSRAPSVIEGALSVIVQNTEITIHNAQIAVFGYGPLGSLLAHALHGLGAKVHVVARNGYQRAAAVALGLEASTLEDASDLAAKLDLLVSTVPSRILERPYLSRLRRGILVMDMASPPGSIDLDAAKELGHRAIWARGLGARAPLTVGRYQWSSARRLIEGLCQADGR